MKSAVLRVVCMGMSAGAGGGERSMCGRRSTERQSEAFDILHGSCRSGACRVHVSD